jgi:hypothetical protein
LTSFHGNLPASCNRASFCASGARKARRRALLLDRELEEFGAAIGVPGATVGAARPRGILGFDLTPSVPRGHSVKGTLEDLPNHELLARTHALIHRGRAVEAELLRHLGEIDARRLYLEAACSSMFVYCVRVLHLSEAAAYKRIRAARAARRHPELLAALRRGDLHVTAVSLLAAQLTSESCGEWIRLARHKTAREIERLLADRQPKPDVADCVRQISVPENSANAAAATVPAPPPVEAPAVKAGEAAGKLVSQRAGDTPSGEAPRVPSRSSTSPLGGERYRVCFTADGELHAQLQELRALMRHQVPDGDLASILGRAVALLLEQVRKRKFAEVSAPRPPKPSTPANEAASRHVPAAIRREVARRDRGRCSYVSPQGARCGAQEFLEFHHVDPWAPHRTHSVDGIALRCRAHNEYAACGDFGEQHMARFRKRAGTGSEAPVAEASAARRPPSSAYTDLGAARQQRLV